MLARNAHIQHITKLSSEKRRERNRNRSGIRNFARPEIAISLTFLRNSVSDTM